jgi:MFS family permease
MFRRFVVVLVCGSIVIALSMGMRQGFGLFLLPVTTDLGMSREVFGFIIGIQNLLWGLTQPIAGLLADKFGAGRVVVAGGVLYVAGLGLAALSTGAGTFGLTVGVLIGLAQSGTAYAVELGGVGLRRRSGAASPSASPRPPVPSACSRWCRRAKG